MNEVDQEKARNHFAQRAAQTAPQSAVEAQVRGRHTGRWRVSDVMTAKALPVTEATGYKQIARLLTEHRLSASSGK